MFSSNVMASCIDSLLDKENLTIKELMDEEDILKECEAEPKKLLDFLIQPHILNEMITFITEEPTEECDERVKYRYSNRACEMLTFDIAQINDALARNEAVLNKLYNFLNTEKPLNPLLASFFRKTMGLLILKKTELVFNFLKDKDFITLAVNHIESSDVMELVLRFATSIENNEMRNMVIKWLHDQKLIQQLVNRIDVDYDEEVNCNASYALRHIIKASREYMSLLQEKADPNPLLETIESVEVVTELLNHIFKDITKESAIVNGVLVLLELLMFKKQGPSGVQQVPSNQSDFLLQAENAQCYMAETEQMTALDSDGLYNGVNSILTAVTPRLGDFHNLLLKPHVKPLITLEVANLISTLISTNNHLVNVRLASFGTISVLLDLFFEYSWDNFLHTHVEYAVGRIVASPCTVDDEGNKIHPLLNTILSEYKITMKILENFEEQPVKGSEKGYMRHLIKIANHIAHNSVGHVNSDFIQEKLKELPEDHQELWHHFVSETLAEINKKNTTQPFINDEKSTDTDASMSSEEMKMDSDNKDGHLLQLYEKLAVSHYKVKKATSQLTQLTQLLAEENSKIAGLEKKSDSELEDRIALLENELRKEKGLKEVLSKSLQEYKELFQITKEENIQLKAQIDEANQQINEKKSDSELEDRIALLENELRKEKGLKEVLSKSLQEYKELFQITKEENIQLKAQIDEANQQINVLKKKIFHIELNTTFRDIEGTISNVRREVAVLQEHLSVLQNTFVKKN